MAGKTETRCILRIHTVPLRALCLTLSILLWNGVAPGGEINWRAGPTEMARLESKELATAIAELANRSNARHVVVQFDRPVNSGQRRQASHAGMTLLRYLGDWQRGNATKDKQHAGGPRFRDLSHQCRFASCSTAAQFIHVQMPPNGSNAETKI